jgi:hypothetical protein
MYTDLPNFVCAASCVIGMMSMPKMDHEGMKLQLNTNQQIFLIRSKIGSRVALAGILAVQLWLLGVPGES